MYVHLFYLHHVMFFNVQYIYMYLSVFFKKYHFYQQIVCVYSECVPHTCTAHVTTTVPP